MSGQVREVLLSKYAFIISIKLSIEHSITCDSRTHLNYTILEDCIIQMCSGITCDRVLKGELCAQRLQKLIYLHLFTDCFMKTSLQSSK